MKKLTRDCRQLKWLSAIISVILANYFVWKRHFHDRFPWKFRCYCLLSRSVGFSFFYHRGRLCIWTVLFGCFVIVPGLEGSNYNAMEGGQVSTDKKACHWPTYAGLCTMDISINLRHPAEAWSMCGYYLGWIRVSKNDVSSSFSEISSFHLCCRNSKLFSIKLWDISLLDKDLYLQLT